MQTRKRMIMMVGTRHDLSRELAAALGLRPGVDEIKHHGWYNPNAITNAGEPGGRPDIIVTEARPSGAANTFRIYVRDLAIAHPQAKIVVIAPGIGSGRFNADAVVHTPAIEDLVEAIRPLLPSETVDA